MQPTTSFGGEHAARFLARHGLADVDALEQVRARSSYYANMVPAVPRNFVRLFDGLSVSVGGRPWRCIAGYGHAPEHIALHDPGGGVLIAGDMVLPGAVCCRSALALSWAALAVTWAMAARLLAIASCESAADCSARRRALS